MSRGHCDSNFLVVLGEMSNIVENLIEGQWQTLVTLWAHAHLAFAFAFAFAIHLASIVFNGTRHT